MISRPTIRLMRKRSSGIFLLVVAAALGYSLIAFPPAISQSYETIRRVNPTLALAYLYLVLALGAFVVCVSGCEDSPNVAAQSQEAPSAETTARHDPAANTTGDR